MPTRNDHLQFCYILHSWQVRCTVSPVNTAVYATEVSSCQWYDRQHTLQIISTIRSIHNSLLTTLVHYTVSFIPGSVFTINSSDQSYLRKSVYSLYRYKSIYLHLVVCCMQPLVSRYIWYRRTRTSICCFVAPTPLQIEGIQAGISISEFFPFYDWPIPI